MSENPVERYDLFGPTARERRERDLERWYIEYDDFSQGVYCTHEPCADGFIVAGLDVADILVKISNHVCN